MKTKLILTVLLSLNLLVLAAPKPKDGFDEERKVFKDQVVLDMEDIGPGDYKALCVAVLEKKDKPKNRKYVVFELTDDLPPKRLVRYMSSAGNELMATADIRVQPKANDGVVYTRVQWHQKTGK